MNEPGVLPAGLLHTGQLSSQSMHTELVLQKHVSLVFWFSILSFKVKRTLAMRKSRKTPFPFPPAMHLFLIWVGRV